MRKLFVVIILCCSVVFTHAENLPNFPFVVASGNAERNVKPDRATIQLRIQALDVESELALSKVNLATTKVINAVEKYKIPLANITATDIEKSTRHMRGSKMNELEVIGYDVSRSMTIKLEDMSHYAELMSDIVIINNLYNANATFDVSNREQIKHELMQEASNKARAQAEQMASGLGVKVSSVYAISQNNNFDIYSAVFGTVAYPSRGMHESMAFRSSSGETLMFVPKTISISQSVNAVFKLD